MHGITLTPLEAEEDLNGHLPSIQTAEDEYYVSVQHEMKKEHYIILTTPDQFSPLAKKQQV